MPKSATNRGRLRTLMLVAVVMGAAVATGLLMTRRRPRQRHAPLASHPPTSSAATPTPARLAASTASAAAVRAVTPSELSTIRVIVSRNDTLDHIFRRLALSLSDLASLRSLPGIRAHLDRLRPGETLTLTAKSGSLVGLERRLNIDQTLKVDRSEPRFHRQCAAEPAGHPRPHHQRQHRLLAVRIDGRRRRP